jgi:hypothetical protein
MESSEGIGINDIIIGSTVSDNKADVRGVVKYDSGLRWRLENGKPG